MRSGELALENNDPRSSHPGLSDKREVDSGTTSSVIMIEISLCAGVSRRTALNDTWPDTKANFCVSQTVHRTKSYVQHR